MKGAVEIKLREIRKIFGDVGEKEMIKRKEYKISCSDGAYCPGGINIFLSLSFIIYGSKYSRFRITQYSIAHDQLMYIFV